MGRCYAGSDTLYTLALPRATVFQFEVIQDLAGKFDVNSMDVYAQPKYSNFPTFDALNCGSLWFQVSRGFKGYRHVDFARLFADNSLRTAWLCQSSAVLMLLFWLQVTVAKKHSEFMGGLTALKAAALPTCDLNKFVHPTLRDNSKPIHMIVTTPDRFDTCYLKQVSYNRPFRGCLLCSMSDVL